MDLAAITIPNFLIKDCTSVIKLASEATSNKKSWQFLFERVTVLRGMVQSIEHLGIMSESVWHALRDLSNVLTEAERLGGKYQTENPFKIGKQKRELKKLSERLRKTLESMSEALQVAQEGMAQAQWPNDALSEAVVHDHVTQV